MSLHVRQGWKRSQPYRLINRLRPRNLVKERVLSSIYWRQEEFLSSQYAYSWTLTGSLTKRLVILINTMQYKLQNVQMVRVIRNQLVVVCSVGFETLQRDIMISDFIQYSDIHESYVFQETLGEGAFAVVKKALYIGDDQPFAIKIIDKKKVSSRDLKMFMNECEIMLFLEHPNIIEIYEVYDNPVYFYIVMEYCEGGELYSNNNLHRLSTEKQIAEVVLTITDALDFCHSKSIVHRDIKPENILWTTKDEEAVLKIADFGFAKLTNQQLMITACGTPMFFSPQILEGKPYDNAVDYWSLGVITYILLSGKPPFEATDQKELFDKIKLGRIEFPQRQWKYISCSAKDFILRLLDKNPKKRYKAEKIRTHPWILSDHKEDLLFRERRQNLKRYQASRQVEKIKFMIEKTISEISTLQEDGQIDLSMVDERDQML